MDKVIYVLNFLFVLDGSKIGRKEMWLFFVPYLVLIMILAPYRDHIDIIAVLMVLLYSFAVVSIKRWKDRGRSPYWVILNFIPVVNIWAGVELLFLPPK